MSTRTTDAFDFSDISNKQEGRIANQVHSAFEKSGMRDGIGTSRKEDKLAHVGDSHQQAQGTSIHSWGTLHKVESVARTFCRYCHVEYGVRNTNQIKPDMVRTFLSELGERNYSRNTIDNYASALERFGVALDRSLHQGNRAETWHKEIDAVRVELVQAAPDLSAGSRAYADPQALVDEISNPVYRAVAGMQLNHGLRLNDALKLHEIAENGAVLHSKGGQVMPVNLSPEEKANLDKIGDVHISKSGYIAALHEAAEATGQAFTGSHGLRHNYAQAQFNGYTAQGMSRSEALQATSEDMGHHRQDITLVYLR